MDPATIMSLLGQSSNMAPSLFQSGLGIAQLIASNRIAKNNKRPDYEIPQGILDAVGVTKGMASQRGIPGENIIQERLDQNQANALSTLKESASSSGDLLSGLQKITGVTEEKTKDLGIAGARNYNANQLNLAKVLEGLSQYQEKQWVLNKYTPYLTAMNAAKELMNAGTQNAYSGFSNVTGVGQNMLKTASPDLLKLFSTGMVENQNDYDIKDIFDYQDNNYFKDAVT